MLGVAYLFENKPDDARREFKKLLELRPDFRFDPLLDPQRVVDFFNASSRKRRRRSRSWRAARRERERARPRRTRADAARLQPAAHGAPLRTAFARGGLHPVRRGAVSERRARARAGRSWAPNRRWRRSRWARSSPTSRSTASARSVPCTDASSPSRRRLPAGPRRPFPGGDVALLLRVQVVSGAAFFAVAIWGVIDAVRHFKHEVPLDGNATATATATARARPPAASDNFRLTLSPTGLGAAWTF